MPVQLNVPLGVLQPSPPNGNGYYDSDAIKEFNAAINAWELLSAAMLTAALNMPWESQAAYTAGANSVFDETAAFEKMKLSSMYSKLKNIFADCCCGKGPISEAIDLKIAGNQPPKSSK